MRYIWSDNLRLQHLSGAPTAPTTQTDHWVVDLGLARKAEFQNDFRAWGTASSENEHIPRAPHQYDFSASPEPESIAGSGSEETR